MTNPAPQAPLTDDDTQTWTFFGHWGDDGRLVLDHATRGEVEDEMPDDGEYEGGLFAASGSGRTMAEAEAEVRAEYEGGSDD